MRIEVHCERICRNAEAIVSMCAPFGIEVVGVTKACCGHPEVARAMLSGGVAFLGESQLNSVRRLREAGVDAPIMLLRIPALSEVDDVVALTQTSLNSEPATLQELSRAAERHHRIHEVIIMVEAGDRREGLMPADVVSVAREARNLPGIRLAGIGTNMACLCGVLPTKESTQSLIVLAEEVERALNVRLQVISSGHSADLGLVGRGEMPSRVNQLRIGGAILRGESLTANHPLPCPHRDAFTVVAEVIELKTKPSLPGGAVCFSTFGHTKEWEDVGSRLRAIVSIGEQYLRTDSLAPRRPGVNVVGASSDQLVLDVTEAEPPVYLGEELEFTPGYSAIATAMASVGVPQVVRPIEP